MRRSHRRHSVNRVSRFEPIEPRLLMSGQPGGDFFLNYFVEDQLHEIYTNLADAHELSGLDQVHANYGFTGTGQTVAVIDTGIAYDHVALGGGLGEGYQVVGGFDFTEEWDADPYDDGPYGSHGTHVAGIIASTDSISSGVAPGVDLVGLRVFNDEGKGYFEWVENALQWVHDNRYAFENPITAVNLSLGTSWNSDSLPSWAMLEEEFAQLEADGMFTSVAAGNSFAAYGEPGLSYPAVSSYVVPVSAVDDDGTLSYFSQRHERAIAAPGRSVASTVPDYVGNANGIDDDFARYSGTSMASPYVAGASVILRQAYEFVGVTDVTQDTIYDLMVSTADTIYDPVTGQDYHRLNLQRAVDTIMPADDFGSTAATAYSLGTLIEGTSLLGTVEQLDDSDWFTFTAGQDGYVTLEVDTTDDMIPQWQLPAGTVSNTAVETQDVVSFNAMAGKTYTVGLGTQDGLGHYTLSVALEPSFSYTDWGVIGQLQFLGNRISGDNQWFAFTAANEAILSTEAFFSSAQGNVDLELFDADRQLLAASRGEGNVERIDVAASAGDTFYLRAYVDGRETNEAVDFRITNLVSQNGDEINVSGTAGDDCFTFAAGAAHQITINDVGYEFDGTIVHSVYFSGGGGSDTAILSGANGNESLLLQVGSARLDGPGYQVQASDVENVTVYGGAGSDTARLYDSAGDDLLVATPGYGELSGEGFVNRVEGFENVQAYSISGGTDVAKLFDSAGDDSFIATPDYAALSGNGFHLQADSFRYVHALSTSGGNDTARLYDSVGDDTFIGNPNYGKLYGDGFYARACSFRYVHALSTAGGTDVARLYDSPGDDTFVGTPRYGKLYGSEFYVRALDFSYVHACSVAGGTDTARLYDSGGNDILIATPTSAKLYGQGFYNRAIGFRYVHAFATAGGVDAAWLYDSAGDDVFIGTSLQSKMMGDEFYNRARFFEKVYAGSGAGGNDQACLRDSTEDDHLAMEGARAQLANAVSAIEIRDFDYIRAIAGSGGTDTTEIAAVDYILELLGDWE